MRSRLSLLARVGAVGLVAVACSGVAPASAQTSGPVAVPVDPPEVQFAMVASHSERAQVQSPLVVAENAPLEQEEYQGTVGLWLPSGVDDSSVVAHLDLAPATGAAPTRTYSTDAAVPADRLSTSRFPSGGKSVLGITMPSDDGVNGPFGALRFDGLTAADGTVLPEFVVPIQFIGTSSGFLQYSTLQLVVTGTSPCAVSSGSPCQPYTVQAGDEVALTVPTGSRLDALGLGALGTQPLAVSLQPVDAAGAPTGASVVLPASGTGTVTVEVPASDAAGLYRLSVVNGDTNDPYGPLQIAETRILLQVTAPPNQGLTSHTDWNDHAQAGDGTSPLVPVGFGLVVAAGATAVVVLRRRTARV